MDFEQLHAAIVSTARREFVGVDPTSPTVATRFANSVCALVGDELARAHAAAGSAERLRDQLNAALGLLDQLELESSQAVAEQDAEISSLQQSLYLAVGERKQHQELLSWLRSEIDQLGLAPAIEDLRKASEKEVEF